MTIILTFHPALNIVFDLLKRMHVKTLPMLKTVLPEPLPTAFRNTKVLRDKLVRSKLKLFDDIELNDFPYGRGNCEFCNILKLGKQFKRTVTGEIFIMNFHFDCNSLCVVCLITWKVCQMQYAGSTVTKFTA